jgi:uncharacterized membrane protein YfcA
LDKSKKKPRNNIVVLSGIGLQMGVTIFLGAYFGKWLDAKYPSDKKWFTMGCILLAVVLSLYSVVQQLNKINQQEDRDKKAK